MGIRPCDRSDLAEVAELALETFPGLTGVGADDLATYFEEVYFENPWADETIPSLVAEQAGGVTGFLGSVPRRMRFRNRSITMAVSASLMVRREASSGRRNPIIAVQLLRRFLDGRQALSLTDTANDVTRRLWTDCGGVIAHPYSYCWLRPLRPFSTCAHFGARAGPPWVGRLVEPLGGIADRLLSMRPVGLLQPPEPKTLVDDIDTAAHLEALHALPSRALMPCYDVASLEWLVTMAERDTSDGTLARRQVRSETGILLGWFIYYRQPNGIGCVLQCVAHPRSTEAVLDSLMSEAYREGLIALWGRTNPTQAALLTRRYCMFFGTPVVLVHSREPEILDAILAGDMFLSGFEGELWMRGNAAL